MIFIILAALVIKLVSFIWQIIHSDNDHVRQIELQANVQSIKCIKIRSLKIIETDSLAELRFMTFVHYEILMNEFFKVYIQVIELDLFENSQL